MKKFNIFSKIFYLFDKSIKYSVLLKCAIFISNIISYIKTVIRNKYKIKGFFFNCSFLTELHYKVASYIQHILSDHIPPP